MPNYKITPRLRDTMVGQAANLCQRRVAQAQTGFPLTQEHVRDTLIPDKWRQVFNAMRADGINTIQTTSLSWIIVDQSHGVDRDALISLQHPAEFYIHSLQGSGSYYLEPMFKRNHATDNMSRLVFDKTILTDDELSSLVKWVNNVVQEKRLSNLALRTITGFINEYQEAGYSIAHIAARWPALKYMVSGDRQWVDRFNNVPRNLKPYKWSVHAETHGWYGKHKKAMALSDMVITSAAMLPAVVNNDVVKATLLTWRPLPTDQDSP